MDLKLNVHVGRQSLVKASSGQLARVDVGLPPFYKGEEVNLEVKLLEDNPNPTTENPFVAKSIDNLSLRVAIGNGLTGTARRVLATQLAFDKADGKFTGTLNLRTQAVLDYLTFPDEWVVDTTYSEGAEAYHELKTWVSLVDNNLGVEPGSDDTKWAEFDIEREPLFFEVEVTRTSQLGTKILHEPCEIRQPVIEHPTVATEDLQDVDALADALAGRLASTNSVQWTRNADLLGQKAAFAVVGNYGDHSNLSAPDWVNDEAVPYQGVRYHDGESAYFIALREFKGTVRFATTAGIDLATTVPGSVVDDLTLDPGDLGVVKDQADDTENGLYKVTSGGLVRASSADIPAEFTPGFVVRVLAGTSNAGTRWALAASVPESVTLGVTSITFEAAGTGVILPTETAFFAPAGTAYGTTAWDETTTFSPPNQVFDNGKHYAAYRASTNVLPTDRRYWAELVKFDTKNAAESVAAKLKTKSPQFVVTTGDNAIDRVYDDHVGRHYRRFIYPYTGNKPLKPGEFDATVNQFFPAPGNLDWGNGDDATIVAGGLDNYLAYFTLPGNERYYSFIKGPVKIIVLDSDVNEPDGNGSSSTQATWLASELANSESPWNVVVFHHSPACSVAGYTPPTMANWDFTGADLVISGGGNVYERLDLSGIVHVVNGFGGIQKEDFGAAVTGSQVRFNDDYGFVMVEANDYALNVKAFTRMGDQIDNWSLLSANGNRLFASVKVDPEGGLEVTPTGLRLKAGLFPATYFVASETEMLALTAKRLDIAVRTDLANKQFQLKAVPASELSNWVPLNETVTDDDPGGGGGGGGGGGSTPSPQPATALSDDTPPTLQVGQTPSAGTAAKALRSDAKPGLPGLATKDAHGFMPKEHFELLDRLGSNAGTDVGFDGPVYVMIRAGDFVYVGGSFTKYGSVSTPNIAKLDLNGKLDPAFEVGTGFTQPIWFLVEADDGGILAATKTQANTYQGVAGHLVWKLNPDGSPAASFNCPNPIADVGAEEIRGLAATESPNAQIIMLTPRTFRITDLNGASVDFINGTESFFDVVGIGGSLVFLSSRAYSAAGVGQEFGGTVDPKGLKLINVTEDPECPGKYAFIDPDFITNGGVGANSSCKRIVTGVDYLGGAYAIVATPRDATEENGVDHSWNGGNELLFRGFYKILSDGNAATGFDIDLTLSEAGAAIPFAVDSNGRLYFGGPVSEINGTAVTPWRLYRIDKTGAFDKEFTGFDDKVTDVVLVNDELLAVSGHFTKWKNRKVGRITFLTSEGLIPGPNPILRTNEGLVATVDALPSVEGNPQFKHYLFYIDGDAIYHWSEAQAKYINICELCSRGPTGVQLPRVVFDPASGTAIGSGINVSMRVPEFSGATIYYTDDGTDPTIKPADGGTRQVYSTPINITAATTFRAYAALTDYADSEEAVAVYDITAIPKLGLVQFNPPSGTSIASSGTQVELTHPESGVEIRYTLDGLAPDSPGSDTKVYSSAILISRATTIKAVAKKNGFLDSDVATADYSFQQTLPPPQFQIHEWNGRGNVDFTMTVSGVNAAIEMRYLYGQTRPPDPKDVLHTRRASNNQHVILPVNVQLVVIARAYAPGWNPSDPAVFVLREAPR